MSATNRTDLTRDVFKAFASGDRERIVVTPRPEFELPLATRSYLDRAGYFTRCWPGSGKREHVRLRPDDPSGGDEVVVTYVATRRDGSRFRNTEVLTFDGEEVAEIEVYFGWNLA